MPALFYFSVAQSPAFVVVVICMPFVYVGCCATAGMLSIRKQEYLQPIYLFEMRPFAAAPAGFLFLYSTTRFVAQNPDQQVCPSTDHLRQNHLLWYTAYSNSKRCRGDVPGQKGMQGFYWRLL